MSVAVAERPKVIAADPIAQLTQIEKHIAGIHSDIVDALRAKHFHLTSVQALILARLGTNELTICELKASDAYLGTNVSYNVRKLSEALYLKRRASSHDQRESYVKYSPSGLEVAALVRNVVARSQHLANLRVLG